MPDVTASVSAPRIAAIEYPLGRSIGQPGDIAGQTAVLCATFRALQEINEPGTTIHLPFRWPEPPKEVHYHPHEPPPIAKAITRRPWLNRNLLNGNIPD